VVPFPRCLSSQDDRFASKAEAKPLYFDARSAPKSRHKKYRPAAATSYSYLTPGIFAVDKP
jgi:hypothetical protein